jgi:catechol 2,3-dioxygenase-like lactoylglutathione lyase family enzyme
VTQSRCLITGLRHIGLAVENFDETVEFYSNIWGLEVVSSESGLAYLASRVDPAAYILRLRQTDEKRVDLIALACANRADLDAFAALLTQQDVRIDRLPAELSTPGGGYGMRFFDCDGRVIEVSADVAERAATSSGLRGLPISLSHVVLNTQDITKTKSFYEEVLGFRLSDWLEDFMCFMRCATTQHHILAFSSGPHASLNHVAYNVESIDSQMRGTGRLMRGGHKVIWGPGRHGAGDNTFSYFIDPAGNICEYTSEMEDVDEATWTVRRFETTDEGQEQWGTGGQPTDHMIPVMFNKPDQGLWKSPPV